MIIRSTIDPLPRQRRFDWLSWGVDMIQSCLLQRHRPPTARDRRRSDRQQHVTIELNEVLDRFAEGFLIVDEKLRIRFANIATCEILDVPRAQLTGRKLDSLKWCDCVVGKRPWHGSSRESHHGQSPPTASPIPVGDEQLIHVERPDCSRRLLAITVRDMSSVEMPGSKVISIRDTTDIETYRARMENLLAHVRRSREEVQQSNEHLQQLVVEDALTGCRNRRSLDEQAAAAWDIYEREQRGLACMMFDIDHFKTVNDNHGHASGDEVLRRFGRLVREVFAGVGQVYRYGGEEFCVLLPGHHLKEAGWIAERVRLTVARMEVHCVTTNEPIPTTVSIGITDVSAGATDATEMIDQADECLYMAKRKGRNCVVAYGPDVAAARFRSSDR